MRKIATVIFAMALCLNAGIVLAKNTNPGPKAEDVKIHKKQMISSEERKALEDSMVKGKPTPVIDPPVFVSPATGEIGASLPTGGQKFALVVGLANYTGTANDLCTAEAETDLAYPTEADGLAYYCQDSDSLHMKEALINEYHYDDDSDDATGEPRNVVLLRDADATRANILAQMEYLKGIVTENDEITFFFSGHGVSGRLITLKDAEKIDEAIYTYHGEPIWDDELKNWIDSFTVNRAFLAFDICLAGGMNDMAGDNRILAMSSGETQNSGVFYLGGTQTDYDDSPVFQESEGLFSHYFVKRGMFNYDGLPDSSNLENTSDGFVAVEEAFTYAYPMVLFKQTPVISDRYAKDLLL